MNPKKVAALSLALVAGAAGDSTTAKELVVSKLKEKANIGLGKVEANSTNVNVLHNMSCHLDAPTC